MKRRYRLSWLFFCLALSLPVGAREAGSGADLKVELQPATSIDFSGLGDEPDPAAEAAPSSKSLRFTLGHETSLNTHQDYSVTNNRSWIRAEYSKLLHNSFFVQLDTKLNAFWSNDHRARAEDKQTLFESSTPEAFVQYSPPGASTSIKVGVQRLIWGESEAGAITDEVSPRNFSELFFIPLEESRLGQFMVSVDRFSPAGDLTVFFVPQPRFNKYPNPGTAYGFDPFGGQADVRRQPYGGSEHEYGMRWKKTFNRSDISFMAASLIDNDYVFRADGVSPQGRLQVSRLKQRFTLTGVTFNYARDKFLLKGEVGFKFPRAFNDESFQVMRKNVVDASLGLTYSLGQNNTIGLEVVNSRVLGWDSRIAGVPRDTSSLVLNANLFFLNDTLSVNWLTIFSQPYTSVTSSIRTAYKWSDNTTLSVDAHLINVPDEKSSLYRYREKGQVFFRVQYQF